MRALLWSAAVVCGGWLVTVLGYTLIGAAATAAAVAPSDGTVVVRETVTTADVLSVLAVLVLVALAVWPGTAVAVIRARLAPRAAAFVGAAGPVAAVAMTLALFASDGGGAGTAAAHAAAAALGCAAGIAAGRSAKPG
ncbi:hypothetical protein J0910_24620 [Nocardiopsis sp. CNT-189]|uniref:hypothetical protein n=1 Tax=Nocardiopsis oceanisediminis TaxID=2816862 RepID=UPI003B2C4602